MNSWRKWFLDSVQFSFQLARQQLVPLAGLFFVMGFFGIQMEDALQLAASQKIQRWDIQVIMGLMDLLEGILLFLILSWGVPKIRTLKSANMLEAPFAQPYLGSFCAEYLRMLGQVLLYGLLLLIPGFVRYCQLVFVPMIALFSRPYREGNQDALQASFQFAKGRMMRIFIALAGTSLIGTGLEFAPQMVEELNTLPFRMAFTLGSDLISILAYSLIFLLFEQAMEQANGTDL